MRKLILVLVSLVSGMVCAQDLELHVVSKGEPIPSARIEWDGGKVLTNSDGRATIQWERGAILKLSIRAAGYEDTLVVVNPNSEVKKLTIALEQVNWLAKDVVVTGSREEESRREAVIRIATLNAGQLATVGAQNVAEGIGFQPGLRMENNCGNCGYSQLRMNGLDGAYNQFLLNGRPVFSSLNSIYGLEQIPVSWIERIEVIRGGGSVLYGPNAIAGVVNIITRDPVVSGVSGQVSAGYMDGKLDQFAGANGVFVSKSNKTGVALSLGQRYRDGYDRNGDGFTNLPVMRGYAGDVHVFHRPSAYSRIGVQLRYLNEFRRGGDALNLPPTEASIAEQIETNALGGEISYEAYLPNRNHKMEVFLATQLTRMDNYYGAEQDPDGYGLTRDANYVAGLRHRWKKDTLNASLRMWSVVSGLEWQHNDLSDEKPGYNVAVFQSIHVLGGYVQTDMAFSRNWKASLGLRASVDNVVMKPILTPRVSLKWNFIPVSAFRLSYATGYRIPQVFSGDVHAELVSGEVQVIRLSSDLSYEYSHGFNLDWTWNFLRKRYDLEFTVNGFANFLNNPFVLERTEDVFGQTILEKRNSTTAWVAGASFDLSFQFVEKWMLQYTLAWQRTNYSTPVEWTPGEFTSQFLRTPDYYGSILLSYAPVKKLMVSVSGLYTGPMWLPHYAGYIEEDRMERSPLMWDMNIKASYTFELPKGVKLECSAGVKNVFDTFQRDLDQGVYRDASYTYGPVRPRTYFVGIRIGNLW